MRADNLNVLQGLPVRVGHECNGCGFCESPCLLRGIDVEDGLAVMGEGCVGCCRYATACRRKAITILLENPDMVSQVCSRLETLKDAR